MYETIKKSYQLLDLNQDLSTCLRLLENLKHKIIFVIDKNKKLCGSVTDGDARRFFIKNIKNKNKVLSLEDIMFKKPNFIYEDEYKKKNFLKIKNFKDINYLPICDRKNRIKKIIILKDIKEVKNNCKVIFMAGGFGKRLLPITKKIPKPNIVLNKNSNLINLMNNFYLNGFSDFIISAYYKYGEIKKEIKKFWFKENKIEYYLEKKPLKSFGSVPRIIKDKKIRDPFLMINADVMTTLNFNSFKEYFYKNKCSFLMGVKIFNITFPYGIVKSKKIYFSSMEEKPQMDINVNAGIYMINPKIMKFFRLNQAYGMDQAIKILKKNKIKIHIFPIKEFWTDIGNREDLEKAKKIAGILNF